MKILPIQQLVMDKMAREWRGVVSVDATVRKGLLVTFTPYSHSDWYCGRWIIGIGGHIRQVDDITDSRRVGHWVDHRLFFK